MAYRWNKLMITVVILFLLCLPFGLLGIDTNVLLGCVAYVLFMYNVILGAYDRPLLKNGWTYKIYI